MRRWLADDALKPWQHRSRIFPRDPHFAVKAEHVRDLYQREWEGHPIGEDEYVLSADEKPGAPSSKPSLRSPKGIPGPWNPGRRPAIAIPRPLNQDPLAGATAIPGQRPVPVNYQGQR
jgi:hypothetical protein